VDDPQPDIGFRLLTCGLRRSAADNRVESVMRRLCVMFSALIVCSVLATGASPLPQQARKPAVGTGPARRAPRLVVLLVVDQLRADYVARFSQHWTGGLRRLLDEGASFPQAAYTYMATVTCVGHNSIATGSLPRTHGIVGNEIWDRAAGRASNCVADSDTTLVSYGGPVKGTGTSTRKLLVPTLPDELRAQVPTPPRIVALSLKDYTATSLAGRRADAALWMNLTAGTLVTSSAFTRATAPWVADFLRAHPIEADFGKTWTRMLPDSAYQFADDAEGERVPGQWTRTFPHALRGAGEKPDDNFYAEWEESPYSDSFLGELAQTSIDALKLGQGAGIDYLAVSFSALDLVGHDFGPRSHEVQDLLSHLDLTIGSLLAHLDRRVGRGNYVLALTGDHGVSPVPEQMAALGLNGGRVLTPALTARIDKALEPFLGPGKLVARMSYNDLFFEPGVYDKLRANPDAMRAALEAARSMPGIARAFSADQLAGVQGTPADELMRAAVASFHPARSGDFIVIPLPYHQFASSAARNSGTTHGSPYWYDRRVPLVLLGKGITRGTYTSPASPTDIAPTLAFLCGITLPAADGRVLDEALVGIDDPRSARRVSRD
jgi:predicted AlkP superfamily pyrophosphatase or phosphodiesterase